MIKVFRMMKPLTKIITLLISLIVVSSAIYAVVTFIQILYRWRSESMKINCMNYSYRNRASGIYFRDSGFGFSYYHNNWR